MDTMAAFLMGEMNRHKEQMVFDWDKAARIIAEKKPKVASAGLRGDWEYTGDDIYAAGEPIKDCYTYLASTWAVPELSLASRITELVQAGQPIKKRMASAKNRYGETVSFCVYSLEREETKC